MDTTALWVLNKIWEKSTQKLCVVQISYNDVFNMLMLLKTPKKKNLFVGYLKGNSREL